MMRSNKRSLIIYGLVPGLTIRLILIVYSIYHDSSSSIKYTDIDYDVFSDASRSILNFSSRDGHQYLEPEDHRSEHRRADLSGERKHSSSFVIGSPYDRATYRYTPLLALLLIPNHLLNRSWGKLLFSISDLSIGYLLYKILLLSTSPSNENRTSSSKLKSNHDSNDQLLKSVIGLWLLNPFSINISTRGSSESLIGLFVITSLYLLKVNRLDLSAIFLGISVHLKLYPIIYGASIWSYLGGFDRVGFFRGLITINKSQIRFGLVALTTLTILNLLMYSIWGYEFLEASYLYHFKRLDHRHNFSPYFYPIYLSFTSKSPSLPSSSSSSSSYSSTSMMIESLKTFTNPRISFIPQMVLSLGLGLFFGPKDLCFSWFIQTYSFVTLNKVITSQYFMWYLWFVPLIVKKITLNKVELGSVILTWVISQALWLSQAYRLEILGEQVFRNVWICSIIFILINAWIIGTLINGFSKSLQKDNIQPKKLKIKN